MQKGLNKAQSSLDKFKRSTDRLVGAIGISLASIGIGEAIKDAMQFETAMEQVTRLMGESSVEFAKWADTTAAGFNMSKLAAMNYGATFANIISTFSTSTEETQKMTQDLLETTAVIASKTGRTMEDALERIRSGMMGNTESIEDLGVYVGIAMIESTQAFRDFAGDRSWQQLDFQTQQTIRYFAILEQAAQKYGATVSSTPTSVLTAQLGNLKLALGQAFLPIWNAVVPALSSMVLWLTKAFSAVAQFTRALFGTSAVKGATSTALAVQGVSNAVGNMGDAYGGATKAAKKAGSAAKKAAKDQKGFLASFDEINSVSDKEDTSAAGGGGGADDAGGGAGGGDLGLGNLDDTMGVFNQVSDAASAAALKVKAFLQGIKDFFGGIKDWVVGHKDIIISVLAGLGAGVLTAFSPKIFAAIVSLFETLYLKALYALGWIKKLLLAVLTPFSAIVVAIALVVAAFVYFYRTNDKFKGFVDGILEKIGDAAIWLWKNALVPLGKFLADNLVKAWDAVTKAAKWLWENILVPFGKFLGQFYTSVLIPLGKVIGEALVIAFNLLADVAKSLWKNVIVPLADFLWTVFKKTMETLGVIFTELWKNVLVPLGKFLSDTFGEQWKGMGVIITTVWNTILKPLAEFIAGVFKKAFDETFKFIGELIGALKKIFVGLNDFIQGVFTQDWGKAWKGISSIFQGVFDGLVSIAKRPLNAIISMINSVISGLNKLNIKIPDWVPEFGGKSFGVNIPKIPALKNGGITNGPTLALIGDNPGGREVVSPLDDLNSMIANAVTTAMEFAGGNNRGGDINLQIDGTTFARIVNGYQQKESKRIGGSLIRTT